MDKILFTDQNVQFPNRYKFVPVDGQDGIYDIVPAFGEVTHEGTPLRALEFNQMQDNVEAALTAQDTGWVDLTYINGFSIYSNSSAPRYRRIGNIVSIKGVAASPAGTALGSTDYTTMFNLPGGTYPTSGTQPTAICQGSGDARWCLTVRNNGEVSASRYANNIGFTSPADGTWMPFNIVYFVE